MVVAAATVAAAVMVQQLDLSAAVLVVVRTPETGDCITPPKEISTKHDST
jgi:hypothetical protein